MKSQYRIILKFVLSIYTILCSSMAFAQSPYHVKLDTLGGLHYWFYKPLTTIPCADGGLLYAGTHNYPINDEKYYFVKLNSTGGVEWAKYCSNSLMMGVVYTINGIGSADSGFYLNVMQWDPMYELFHVSHTMKIDKIGNLQGEIISGNIGNALVLQDLDTLNNSSLFYSQHEGYDPVEDEPCCFESYYGSFNPGLQPVFLKKLIWGGMPDEEYYRIKYLYSNDTIIGYMALSIDAYNRPVVTRLGSSHNVIWRKSFGRTRFTDFVQLDSSIFLIGYRSLTQGAVIHKIDLNGNTNFDKIISSPIWPNLMAFKADIGNDTTILLGLSTTPYAPAASSSNAPLFVQIDTSGNIISSAYVSDSTNVLHLLNYSSRKGEIYCPLYYYGLQIRKMVIDSMSCNLDTVALSTTNYNTIDSTFTAFSSPYTYSFTPYFDLLDPVAIASIDICGINFTGIAPYLPETNDISIFPNPAYDKLEISSPFTIDDLMLMNISGQIMHIPNTFNNYSSLDLSDIPDGIYFIRITTSTRTFLKKLVKVSSD